MDDSSSSAHPALPSPVETEVTPSELDEILKSKDASAVRVVDCREEDEFAICRLPDAELIPLSRFGELAPPNLLEGEDQRPVVIYCHHGMRSLNATMFLRERGRPDVWSLAGGIDLWSQQIDPSVPRY